MAFVDLIYGRLLLVTGKGGTGKSSVAAALGRLAAAQGRKTLVVEIDAQNPAMKAIYGVEPNYEPLEVAPNLFVANLNWMTNLSDWVSRVLPGGRMVRMVLQNPLVQSFLEVAPGNREVVALSKIGWLVEEFDLVVVDLAASGHALAMLEVPNTMVGLFPSGPIRKEGEKALELLGQESTHLVLVALPEEMVVNETVETFEAIRSKVPQLRIDAVLLNKTSVPSLTAAESELLKALSKEVQSEAAKELLWAGRWESELEKATHSAEVRLDQELATKVISIPRLSHEGGPRQLVQQIAAAMARATHNEHSQ
jgi:anion-transporting  ArsA/GET3 family ATPase